MPIPQRRMRGAGFTFFLVVATALSAGCGGNGTQGPVIPTATPGPTATPTPVVIQTSAPFTASVQAPIPAVTPPPVGHTPAPVPVSLPTSSSGITGQISLPITQAPAGTQAQVNMTNTAPTGLPPLDYAHSTFAQFRPMDLSNISVLLYVSVAFSSGVSLSNQPNVAFTLPSTQIVNGVYYYLAFYDPTRPLVGWQLGFEGPGSVSGDTVSFSGSNTGAFNYAPFQFYVFGLYVVPQALPTPTPAPTPTPTPEPTPTPTPVVLAGVSLTAIGQTAAVASTVGTPGAAFSSNTSVVTTTVVGNSAIITAAGVGTATVTIGGPNGTMTVPVTVTTTTIPVQ